MSKKSHITQISIARLYNLGNYEHVRFELTAEVSKGGNPKQTLFDLASIAQCLKPIKKPYNYETALEVTMKPQEAMTEAEKFRLDEYIEIVKNYASIKERRAAAIQLLEDLGGTSKRTDAKDTWQDSDDTPW